MQINKRKIVSAAKTLVVSVIQIITYVAICEFALYILGRLFPRSGDIGWGIMYRCSIVLISLLIVVGNFISAGYFRDKLKPSIIVSCTSLMIFVLYLLPGYSDTPYKTSILLFSAIVAFSVKYLARLNTKQRIVVTLCATLLPLSMICIIYFVPCNVVWVTGDETLKKELKIDLYQQTDLCCGYERREVYTGNGSIFMIRDEYGEHRFLMKHESCCETYGFFKIRAWYDMFIRLHFYSSGGKTYCDVSHWTGLERYQTTICVDGDSSKQTHLDEFICAE